MLSFMADGFPTVGAFGLRDHQAASDWLDGDRRKLRSGPVEISPWGGDIDMT